MKRWIVVNDDTLKDLGGIRQQHSMRGPADFFDEVAPNGHSMGSINKKHISPEDLHRPDFEKKLIRLTISNYFRNLIREAMKILKLAITSKLSRNEMFRFDQEEKSFHRTEIPPHSGGLGSSFEIRDDATKLITKMNAKGEVLLVSRFDQYHHRKLKIGSREIEVWIEYRDSSYQEADNLRIDSSIPPKSMKPSSGTDIISHLFMKVSNGERHELQKIHMLCVRYGEHKIMTPIFHSPKYGLVTTFAKWCGDKLVLYDTHIVKIFTF